MDNLPLEPMLAVVALLVLWSALFTAIEAAQNICWPCDLAPARVTKPPPA